MCNLKKSQVADSDVLTLCGVEARGEKCLLKVLIPSERWDVTKETLVPNGGAVQFNRSHLIR